IEVIFAFDDLITRLTSVFFAATDMTWKQAFSVRLLYSCWMLSAVVLVTIYSCFFYSSLTLPKFEPLVDTVDDLVRLAQSDHYRVYQKNGSTNIRKLIVSSLPEHGPLYIIGQHINR